MRSPPPALSVARLSDGPIEGYLLTFWRIFYASVSREFLIRNVTRPYCCDVLRQSLAASPYLRSKWVSSKRYVAEFNALVLCGVFLWKNATFYMRKTLLL